MWVLPPNLMVEGTSGAWCEVPVRYLIPVGYLTHAVSGARIWAMATSPLPAQVWAKHWKNFWLERCGATINKHCHFPSFPPISPNFSVGPNGEKWELPAPPVWCGADGPNRPQCTIVMEVFTHVCFMWPLQAVATKSVKCLPSLLYAKHARLFDHPVPVVSQEELQNLFGHLQVSCGDGCSVVQRAVQRSMKTLVECQKAMTATIHARMPHALSRPSSSPMGRMQPPALAVTGTDPLDHFDSDSEEALYSDDDEDP